MYTPKPVEAFHNDPQRPILFNSPSLELSIEQQGLIKDALDYACSDSKFAEKAYDAIYHILTVGSSPTPTVESLSPNTAAVNTTPTVTVNGSGFDSGAQIYVSGNPIDTEFASDKSVSGVFDLNSMLPGVLPVQVRNGNTALSNTLPFAVTTASGQSNSGQDSDAQKSVTFSKSVTVSK